MGKKLPPDQLELYKKIDEILYYEWDPIGVSAINGPKDEYQSYLPQIFKMAMQDTPIAVIAKSLTDLATEGMGLTPDAGHDKKAAEAIMQAKKKCILGN